MVLDIFEQMLFGNGAYILFMIISIMGFVGIYLYKYFGLISAFLLTIIGLKYLSIYSTEPDNDLLIFFAFSLICAILQIFAMLKMKK